MSAQVDAETEGTMASSQELALLEKKELAAKEEKTVPGRYYIPYTDIYETDETLTVVMEMPGVEKKDLSVMLENDVLRVDGRIDLNRPGFPGGSTSQVGWSHDKQSDEQIQFGGPRPCGANGIGPRERTPVAVGGCDLHCREDRMLHAHADGLGQEGRY
jgi:hypothetical protein